VRRAAVQNRRRWLRPPHRRAARVDGCRRRHRNWSSHPRSRRLRSHFRRSPRTIGTPTSRERAPEHSEQSTWSTFGRQPGYALPSDRRIRIIRTHQFVKYERSVFTCRRWAHRPLLHASFVCRSHRRRRGNRASRRPALSPQGLCFTYCAREAGAAASGFVQRLDSDIDAARQVTLVSLFSWLATTTSHGACQNTICCGTI